MNSTGDELDGNVSSIAALIASPGETGVSLREAITAANNTPNVGGPDEIRFGISASAAGHVYYRDDSVAGQVSLANVTLTTAADDTTIADIDPDWAHSWFAIAVSTASLPSITEPVIIDGYSQSGAARNTNAFDQGSNAVLKIELTRTDILDIFSGLVITSGGTTVSGLTINNFRGAGIFLGVPFSNTQTPGGNTIDGNFVGMDVSGTLTIANGAGTNEGGVFVRNTPNNTIGGATPGARNLLSGNVADGAHLFGTGATGNQVLGNLIGTDRTGTLSRGNAQNGVQISQGASSNTVGGHNLLSGHTGAGVQVQGTGTNANLIVGNLIGTEITGTQAMGNSWGVLVTFGASNNTVGGTTLTARNVISANSFGVLVSASGVATTGNVIQGNLIGTDLAGTAALGNAKGIELSGATNTLIGGTVAGAGNVISGNNNGITTFFPATNSTIQGNFIGVDITGTQDLGNATQGINLAPNSNNNTISSNLISGNDQSGVVLNGSGNLVQGNRIGTNAGGTAGIGNAIDGVAVGGGNNTIDQNLISANGQHGINIQGTGTTNTRITGNLIGTDVTGMTALGNAGIGILIAQAGNAVGGTTTAERNIISGNGSHGVVISPSTDNNARDNVVQGNYIGTNLSGGGPIPNQQDGIHLGGAGPANIIGGTEPGAGNLISGNGDNGVAIVNGAFSNVVLGNRIGTTVNGESALGNHNLGVRVTESPNNTIGGTAPGAGNLISGNGTSGGEGLGIRIDGAPSKGTIVQSNMIGTNISATLPLGNVHGGIRIMLGAADSRIGGTEAGAGNVIAYNGGIGVAVETNATRNAILGNAILNNAGLGIDLASDGVTTNDAGDADTGANNLQNFPVLSSALSAGGTTTIQGSLNGIASTMFRLEFFANAAADPTGFGEGQSFLGSVNVTTDGTGNTPFTATLPVTVADGMFFTATATMLLPPGGPQPFGDTSEFSGPFQIQEVCSTMVINTNDAGLGSLRAAIDCANTTPGLDTITFTIPANDSGHVYYHDDGVAGQVSLANVMTTTAADDSTIADIDPDWAHSWFRILPQTQLPGITNPVIIDAADAATHSFGTHRIELNGSQAVIVPGGNAPSGLIIDAGNSTVRGLVINSFDTHGILMQVVGGNVIESNYVGTDVSGTVAKANGTPGGAGFGIVGLANNTIGGLAGKGNLVSGNLNPGIVVTGSGNLVQGNRVGTSAAGTAALANGSDGIGVLAGQNTIDQNVVSGNGNYGISVGAGAAATGVIITGNQIGTNAAGTLSLPNANGGILYTSSNGRIGGTTAAERNIISGNNGTGLGLVAGASGNQIIGNFIGTDQSGTVALANKGHGISVSDAATVNNFIGGAAAGQGNLISGNQNDGIFILATSGHTVRGNRIGTDLTGTVSIPNGGNGVTVFNSANNVIGGSAANAGNLISGNTNSGIVITNSQSTGNTIAGNRIGTNLSGTVALANQGVAGIEIVGGASDNVVGGSIVGNRNLISGNAKIGIWMDGAGNNNVMKGNFIGTDVNGTGALTNQRNGVQINQSGITTVGGSTELERNVISGNLEYGIAIRASSGSLVQGNFIGTDALGSAPVPNGRAGIFISSGTNNLIGGLTAVPGTGVGNVISGNILSGVNLGEVGPNGNLVKGNLIGTDRTGTFAVGSQAIGIDVSDNASGNLIGGTVQGARNVISGNHEGGVLIAGAAHDNQVQGNYIGTDISGSLPLGNVIAGVHLGESATANLIGGATAGAGNVISGNIGVGVNFYRGAAGNTVQGNFIGTDSTGANPLGNQGDGVMVQTGDHNTIQANVISSNSGNGMTIVFSTGNIVQGNYIGTNASGVTDVSGPGPNSFGNGGDGIDLIGSTNNTIGGTVAGAQNLISGNRNNAVRIEWGTNAGNFVPSTDNIVQGNFLGTNLAGTAAMGNGQDGVRISRSSNNTIGGTTAAARNIISGNGQNGIGISGSESSGNVIQGNYIGTNAAGNAMIGNAALGLGIEDAVDNTIGGTASGAGNVISGNPIGIGISGSGVTTGNLIQGNLIGTDKTGTAALGNVIGIGIANGTGVTIGGTAAGAGNTIAGNGIVGLAIVASSPSETLANNQVLGNFVGTNAAGSTVLGNGGGDPNALVTVVNQALVALGSPVPPLTADQLAALDGGIVISGAAGNVIGGSAPGAANVIAFNKASPLLAPSSGAGVQVNFGVSNLISRNSIFANQGLGIDLVNNGNNNQPAPVLTAVRSGGGTTNIVGALTAAPSSTFTLEYFSNLPGDFPQGRKFLGTGTVTTDGSGAGAFNVTLPVSVPAGAKVTATATDPASNTSEFSMSETVVPKQGLPECEVVTRNAPGRQASAVLADDADHPGQTVLIVTGTAAGDALVIEPRPSNQMQVRVKGTGKLLGIFSNLAIQHVVAFGLGGNDTIVVDARISQPATLLGGPGNDSLYGGKGSDALDGGSGNDSLYGGAGNDTLCGGDGNDNVYGQNGNDTVGGDAGNDRVYGDAGNDRVLGGAGNDLLFGGSGNDMLFGQDGNDQLFGDAGNDIAVGGDGNDKLSGSTGRDVLIGGIGQDRLIGEQQDDIVVGGTTEHDNNDAALSVILAEWGSSHSFSERIANLDGLLNSSTVHDDGTRDTLDGGSDRDWLLDYLLADTINGFGSNPTKGDKKN